MIYVKEEEVLKIKLSPNNIKTGYNYKYNGKEYQDELGLNEYAFGWRDYDPAIGRWNGIDVFAEKYSSTSPYAFCNNSPLINREIDGRDFDKKNEKKAKKIEKQLDKQIAKLNKEIAKLQKNGQSIGDRNDRITQMNKSKSDVSDMRGDHNNFYKFEKSSQNNGNPETKRTGANEITMFTDDFSKQIHEGRHGGQIARGEYNLDMNGALTSGTFGVSKEIDAYQAQYGYDGKIDYRSNLPVSPTDALKALQAGKDPTITTITNFNQITPSAVNSMTDPGYINIYPPVGIPLIDWNKN